VRTDDGCRVHCLTLALAFLAIVAAIIAGVVVAL
jgi:hypothetical protein